jgi:hypothetical protein
MTTLKEARKVAAKFKATIRDGKNGNFHECAIEAPKGHVWSGSDLHELVSDAYVPWKPDYKDLVERMNYGVRPCDDPECEWCSS